MPNGNRLKGQRDFDDQQRHVFQLTSGQLVAGISGLIILALACFLLGMAVERLQNPGWVRAQTAPPQTVPEKTPVAPQTKPTGEGVQTSPKPSVVTAQPLPPPAKPAPASQPKEPQPATASETRIVKLAAPEPTERVGPAPATSSPVPVAVPPPTATSAEDGTPPKPSTGELEPLPPAKQASTAPSETPPPGGAGTPSVGTTTPSEETAKGAFTVQLSASSAAKRAFAEDQKRKVEQLSAMKAELVLSEDGKLLRVFVGRFADQVAAEKTRDELRKNKEFADCFVKRLPQ